MTECLSHDAWFRREHALHHLAYNHISRHLKKAVPRFSLAGTIFQSAASVIG